MPETPTPQPGPSVPHRLHELAQLLRSAEHLDPAAQKALADLVDELSGALQPDAISSAETAHLAESTRQLLESLHRSGDPGHRDSLKHRLEAAIVRAEAEAPLATGLARRLIDTLANLGI